jgi:hypothetical protein
MFNPRTYNQSIRHSRFGGVGVDHLAATAPQAEKVLNRERRITAGYSGPVSVAKRPLREHHFGGARLRSDAHALNLNRVKILTENSWTVGFSRTLGASPARTMAPLPPEPKTQFQLGLSHSSR